MNLMNDLDPIHEARVDELVEKEELANLSRITASVRKRQMMELLLSIAELQEESLRVQRHILAALTAATDSGTGQTVHLQATAPVDEQTED